MFVYFLKRESKGQPLGICATEDSGKMTVGMLARNGLADRKNDALQENPRACNQILRRGDIIDNINGKTKVETIRMEMMTAMCLAMAIRRPTVVVVELDEDDMGVDAILCQGGVLMAARDYNPRPEPEHDSGYLKVDKGCPVKIYGGCEEPGNSDNVYGKYAYAELYSPTEEQLIPRQDGTYPCRGWVPTDVLSLPPPGWCRYHNLWQPLSTVQED